MAGLPRRFPAVGSGAASRKTPEAINGVTITVTVLRLTANRRRGRLSFAQFDRRPAVATVRPAPVLPSCSDFFFVRRGHQSSFGFCD